MEGSVARHTQYGERMAKKNSGKIAGCLIGGIIFLQVLTIVIILLIL